MSHRCQVHHPIFCILPPHILREIAVRGNNTQRKFALDTLSLDTSLRSTRTEQSLIASFAIKAAPILRAPVVHREIYDAGQSTDLPGKLVRGEAQPASADANVNEAYDGLGATFNFYLNVLKRNSIDNAGMALKGTVHYSSGYNNAFWNGQQMVFGDGDGEIFKDFTKPIDVIGHELTHGVTQYESGLAYHDQPGALNESMSDVFGTMIKQYALNQTTNSADWLIGAGLIAQYPTQSLRSMKAPGTAYNNPVMGTDPQPADMANYLQTAEDNGGVHLNSGIPNRAFYETVNTLAKANPNEHSWDRGGLIWYDTQRDVQLHKIAQTVTFKDFADLTVSNAASRFGTTSAERAAVEGAWTTVGVI